MKNKKVIIITGIVAGAIVLLALIFGILIALGGKRADVYLKDFEYDKTSNTITLNVGVASSAGYVRRMKTSTIGNDYNLTFFSTFGINSKLGAKDTFKIKLDENINRVYFCSDENVYEKVLEKDENGDWVIAK